MRAFLSNKVVWALPRLTAILAVYIADCGQVGRWHRLHSNRSIEESEVVSHILHRTHAQRACVAMAPTILCEARHMHDVSASETLQGLG